MSSLRRSVFVGTGIALLLTLAFTTPRTADAAPAADPGNTVLIYDQTVIGGLGSQEAIAAANLGFTVEVANAADWAAKSAADFATYRAIVLGDPSCGALPAVAVPEANASVWGPVLNGNVVLIGTDEVFHTGQGGEQVTPAVMGFATSEVGKTGALLSLSCYYHGVAAMTPVPLLDGINLGGFTMTGVGCYNDAHIVASSPALSGLTDVTLSNWSCSVHEAFDKWPPDFQVLAMARGIGTSFTASDGSVGTPYILARGASITTTGLSVTPTSATNPVGTSHTVTATLTDTGTGLPVANALINFSIIAGPNTGASGTCNPVSCRTGADGKVEFTYTDAAGPGTDSIRAFHDVNENTTAESGEPIVVVAKTWELPTGCVPADCNDENPCTNDACQSNVCVNVPNTALCDDASPCTDDTCTPDASPAGYTCGHTDNGSCDPCGNGTIDTGETCDPPGSPTGPFGRTCGPTCTFCGDAIIQPGETCDDGNNLECDPVHPQKALDQCSNTCTGYDCKDPARVILRSGRLDVLKYHARLIPVSGDSIAVGDFTMTLKTDRHIIFEDTAPNGSITRLANDRGFRYANRAARENGGIYKLLATRAKGSYKVTIVAYGQLDHSSTDMVPRFVINGLEWVGNGGWRRTNTGWLLNE